MIRTVGPLLTKLSRIFLFVCLCFAGVAASAVETLSDYQLGSGDTIEIKVYDEPDLSFEVRLSDAGTISYPFLGEIRVLGLTVGQLEQKIREGLRGDYLVDPEVTVSMVEYRPFYINGEVKEPGGFPYVPGITLRKAVAIAGGFTERASRSKIYVIRDSAPVGEEGRQIGLDERVMPGDIITVEQSFF